VGPHRPRSFANRFRLPRVMVKMRRSGHEDRKCCRSRPAERAGWTRASPTVSCVRCAREGSDARRGLGCVRVPFLPRPPLPPWRPRPALLEPPRRGTGERRARSLRMTDPGRSSARGEGPRGMDRTRLLLLVGVRGRAVACWRPWTSTTQARAYRNDWIHRLDTAVGAHWITQRGRCDPRRWPVRAERLGHSPNRGSLDSRLRVHATPRRSGRRRCCLLL
jgi:hypothetical protein